MSDDLDYRICTDARTKGGGHPPTRMHPTSLTRLEWRCPVCGGEWADPVGWVGPVHVDSLFPPGGWSA